MSILPPTICSLLPSATEIVFALGLGDRLAAVTHECDFPPEAARLPVITRSTLNDHESRRSHDIHTHISTALHGGSSIYRLDQPLLERLAPDLILTQELCDVCAVSYGLVEEAVLRLAGKRQVLSLEPTSLGGILSSIEQVAGAADVPDRAAPLVATLGRRIEAVTAQAREAATRPHVLALAWLDPLFTGGHWVPEMVRLAGGLDVLGVEGRPSTQTAWSRVIETAPEVIVLMPCGFTLDRTLEEFAHVTLPEEWSGLSAVRSGRIYAVNGSAYFNRPGPRIVLGLQILAEIIHPEVFTRTTPPGAWQRLAV